MHSFSLPVYTHDFPCINTWERAAQAVEAQTRICLQLTEGTLALSWLISHTVSVSPHRNNVHKLLLFLICRAFGLWPKFS